VCFVRPGDADSENRLDVEGPVLRDSLRGEETRRLLPAYDLAVRNFGFEVMGHLINVYAFGKCLAVEPRNFRDFHGPILGLATQS
jgi:hypothetical protein